MRSNPFAYGEITMWKGVLFLRKDDVKPGGPTQMVLGVALGGVVAIGVELLVLLAGAAAISSASAFAPSAASIFWKSVLKSVRRKSSLASHWCS